ncbi:MAG: hypothetical protein QUV20_01790 [Oceanibaculum nanhaiense]|nr:hypothetical protein [Oceanibaculum nanhaiense]MDM7945038.1 hypothetical protein [Oceanibaculum nanhaiense]
MISSEKPRIAFSGVRRSVRHVRQEFGLAALGPLRLAALQQQGHLALFLNRDVHLGDEDAAILQQLQFAAQPAPVGQLLLRIGPGRAPFGHQPVDPVLARFDALRRQHPGGKTIVQDIAPAPADPEMRRPVGEKLPESGIAASQPVHRIIDHHPDIRSVERPPDQLSLHGCPRRRCLLAIFCHRRTPHQGNPTRLSGVAIPYETVLFAGADAVDFAGPFSWLFLACARQARHFSKITYAARRQPPGFCRNAFCRSWRRGECE